MGKWLDLAAKLEADGRANRDNRDNSSPNVLNVPNVPGDLPRSVQQGLVRLGTMAAPRIMRPEIWPTVVGDACRLAADGWAATALGLGWSPLDLFGAAPDPEGDPDADGLAVKLGGRRILAICEGFATVADANGGRSYLYRGNNAGAVLMWVLGRLHGSEGND